MKKKKHLFPKVSLMSCLLLTAMPLQTAFADAPNFLVEPIAGTQIGTLPIIPGIHDDMIQEMIEAYKEQTKKLVIQKIKPFLINEAQYHRDVESINNDINSLIEEIESEENGLYGIHLALKQEIQRIAAELSYYKFTQEAKYLEDSGKLTFPELDEAYIDLLVNHKTSHRTLVKYENKVEGRAPLEALIVPLRSRLRTIHGLSLK
ncbi:hypothetical protein [Erysipelothrix piscisicarius]|uniref:hypothetical protein n=1 Tax=Erysipelothrix piscisicarius TaxID=2485784 RepID=UPI002F954157